MNSADLKKFIMQETQNLINEGHSVSKLYDLMKDVDTGFVNNYQKQLDSLIKKEETAREKEDFIQLKDAKNDQVAIIEKLVIAYKKKIEYLEKIKEESKNELSDISSKGVKAFSDKHLKEFAHESFKRGDKLAIISSSSKTIVEKIGEINAYKVISSDINGILPEDVLKLPNLKIGEGGKVSIYRKVGDKVKEISNFDYKVIIDLIKNPAA